jgi:U5 small nuclear ribonucleoprotein component
MDDLYDEFGNFIGDETAEASEEESQRGVGAGNYAYDDDYPEEAPEATGQELMDIDGVHSTNLPMSF